MFYCESCKIKYDWPESYSLSKGACEMCHEYAICYDRPSSSLPYSTPVKQSKEFTLVDWIETKDAT